MKKQAGKDPWGAKDRKKREAERQRSQASRRASEGPAPKQAPGKARKARPPRPPQQQKQEQRREHARRDRSGPARKRRRVTLVLLALAALAIVAVVLAGPVTRNINAAREIDAKQAELEREQAVTQDLEDRRDNANDMTFLEKEARRIGYVLPGEIPVVVIDEGAPEEAQLEVQLPEEEQPEGEVPPATGEEGAEQAPAP